jgi:hypothetical protein
MSSGHQFGDTIHIFSELGTVSPNYGVPGTIIPADLLDTVSAGGAFCTVEQLRARFDELLAWMTRGREAARVRVLITRGEQSEAPS